MSVSKEKMQEFRDRMESYNYLRQNRVAYWQSIAIVFGTSAVILLINLITKDNLFLQIVIILGLFILANLAYKQSVKQTQKPIFVGDNIIGTVEKNPVSVKDKDGREYSIFSMSDIQYNADKPKKEHSQ